MIKFEELKSVIAQLTDLGCFERPFEIQAVCIDRFGLDGYKQLDEIGVTDTIVVPWLFYGVGFDGSLQAKKDGLRRFADEVIGEFA
jgi:hypothetical protein